MLFKTLLYREKLIKSLTDFHVEIFLKRVVTSLLHYRKITIEELSRKIVRAHLSQRTLSINQIDQLHFL